MYKLIFFQLFLLCISVACKNNVLLQKTNTLEKTKLDTIVYNKLTIKKENKPDINKKFDPLKVKKLITDSSSEPFMQFSNNLKSDLDTFLKSMFFMDNSLSSIKYYESTIELYFLKNDSVNFYEKIIGDSTQWIFNHYRYHDIYYSLFNFSKVDYIKVFIKEEGSVNSIDSASHMNLITKNITLLPLSGDYEIKLPKGSMKREWYRAKENYWDFFKGPILDKKSTFNEDVIKESVLDSIFSK